jgi:hypothetical protein
MGLGAVMSDEQDRYVTALIAVLFVGALVLIGLAGYYSEVM